MSEIPEVVELENNEDKDIEQSDKHTLCDSKEHVGEIFEFVQTDNIRDNDAEKSDKHTPNDS